MSSYNTGTAKTLWLGMLSDGQYRPQAELRKIYTGLNRIDRVLQQLVAQGSCQRIPDASRPGGVLFGVTPECVIPRNVQLHEVAAYTSEPRPMVASVWDLGQTGRKVSPLGAWD